MTVTKKQFKNINEWVKIQALPLRCVSFGKASEAAGLQPRLAKRMHQEGCCEGPTRFHAVQRTHLRNAGVRIL